MKRIKKGLMILLALCLVVTMIPQTAFAANTASDDIVVLYTGNIRGSADANIGLAGVRAYAKDKLVNDGSYIEVVDTGNALSGSALANASKGKFAAEAMNSVGFGIAVPGVHDFDFGVEALTNEIASIADFSYVSCNFVNLYTGTTVFKPYKIVSYGNTKIAYLGISDPQTAEKSLTSFNDGTKDNYSFGYTKDGKNLYAVVQSAVNAAKAEGADYVIAIGDLEASGSTSSAKSILQNTEGIQAFLLGGSSGAISGEQVKCKDGNAAILTSPGANLENIGVLTLSPGESLTVQLVSGYNLRDILTVSTIENLKEKYTAQMKWAFAENGHTLRIADDNGVRIVGKSETNLGDLCADAFKNVTGADIAFVEARDILSNLSVGEITYSDISKVMPGNKSVSVMSVSGYEILDALEMSARLCPSNNEGFLQISGITFDIQETIKSTVTLGSNGEFKDVTKDYRVTNVMINGRELDLMEEYTVAATSDFFSGNTGYTMFSGSVMKAEDVMTDNQALTEYIKKKLGGNIGDEYMEAQGRIDFIKLARQSEINAEIEAGVNERLKNYSEEMEALREQIALQKEIIDIRTMTIKATTAVKKSGSKRSMKVAWTVSKEIDGMKFQIYKSQSKSSGYKKMFTTSKSTYTNTSGIKKGSRYYYKVRGYKYVSGKYYYTDWSNITYKKVS